MFQLNNTERSKVPKPYEVAVDEREASGKMDELAAIKSIQISLSQLTVGETVSAKTVHQRLREL